jgi:hypothetical protein
MNIDNIGIFSGGAICTCGDDLSRNGGFIHNYACPMTPKCPHMVSKIDQRTGETIQTPCGSRLDQYVCHSFGCPLLPLCPHCGTSMDRRGVHSIGCPNRPSYSQGYSQGYSHSGIHLPNGIVRLPGESRIPNHRNLLQNYLEIFANVIRNMPALPPRNPVSSPTIIDGDFEIEGQCSICFNQCDESQSVMKPSGCVHCFHADCLTPWIIHHSTCPNCRREIQTILKKN